MKWILLAFAVINATLLSVFSDTEGHVGATTLLMFNIPVVVAGLIIYAIIRLTSDR